MKKFKKVILISGTSSGIGKYLAVKLSQNNTVIGFSRGKSNIKNKNYYHHRLDINKNKKLETLIKNIMTKHKKIDILINNAATNISHGNFFFISKDSIIDTINTNLISLILLTKGVSRKMMIEKSGAIINLGSSVTKILPEGESIYAASKAGLITFSKILSKELIKFNITCNCISPFLVNTQMIKKIANKKIISLLKKKKLNRPSEILAIIQKIITTNVNGKNFEL